MPLRGEGYVVELSTAGELARDAATYRALDAGLWSPRGRTGARHGIRVGGGLEVEVVSGTPESWRVQPGHCVLLAPNGQMYRVVFPNTKTDTITRPTSTGQSRIDRFIARVYDSEGGYGGELSARIERVQGDPSTGTPVTPGIPSGAVALHLGTLTIPNSGTIQPSLTTRRTAAAGGIIPTTSAERQMLVDDGDAYPGRAVWNTVTDHLDVYRSLANGWSEDSGDINFSVAGTTLWTNPDNNAKLRRVDKHVAINGYLVRQTSDLTAGSGTAHTFANVVPAGFTPTSTQVCRTAYATNRRVTAELMTDRSLRVTAEGSALPVGSNVDVIFNYFTA